MTYSISPPSYKITSLRWQSLNLWIICSKVIIDKNFINRHVIFSHEWIFWISISFFQLSKILLFSYMVVDSIFVGDSHKFLAHVELYTLTKHIQNFPRNSIWLDDVATMVYFIYHHKTIVLPHLNKHLVYDQLLWHCENM